MILNKGEITKANIVTGAVPASRRSTTYDATIGEIISEGAIVDSDSYTLEKRGIVWVVSNEVFTFGATHTGLATLRTTWTHKGVLALNVGVIDPGWSGPLATALVNFSARRVRIEKGQAFFRVIVFEHNKTAMKKVVKDKYQYIEEIREKSCSISNTFLDMHSLVDEVALSVFKIPKLAVGLTFAGIMIAVVAIFATIAWDVLRVGKQTEVAVQAIERRVELLEK